MEVYAKQAKDGRLIAYATEIRKRAERRLGELMGAARKAGKLAKGTRGQLKSAGPGRGKKGKTGRVTKTPPVSQEKSLSKQGIDKNLAKRARKTAAMSEAKFEAEVARAVKTAVAAAEDNKAGSAS
jgi:hypothetical protein